MKTKNLAGGKAFTIDDASVKLITLIGSSLFNEPSYYDKGDEGLTDRAKEVISTAREVANSDNPRDLLAIAAWARTELNLRTTPQVLLAVAANENKTKEFVRSYTTRIIKRVDELKDVVAANNMLNFGKASVLATEAKRSLPNSLKRGLADAAAKFGEAQYLKYNTSDHPSFRDVFAIIERGRNKPISHALYSFLSFGEVPAGEEGDVPLVMARKKLATFKELTPEAQEQARLSHATWEVLVSQFGNKPEVWETVIPQMGYMALLRNLRNILEAKVSVTTLDGVLKRISDKEEVLKSKQLPFRFYAAAKMLQESDIEPTRVKKVVSALNKALTASIENVSDIDGNTVVLLDVSGSMGSPVSGKSKISCAEAGAVLTAILEEASKNTRTFAFATEVGEVARKKDTTILDRVKELVNSPNFGGGTDAWKGMAELTKNKVNADRIVLISDMQCYHSGFESRERSVDGGLKAYKKTVNPDVFFHSIDLAGYGTSQTSSDKNVNLVAGYSEKILNTISASEGVTTDAIPTIEDIRARF